MFVEISFRRILSNAAGEALKTLLDPTVTLLDPTLAHRILGSNAAHAAMGSRPVATPAAEASPEPVPVHLPEGSWRVGWLTSRTSVRWSLELILHSLVVLNSDAARDIPRISFGNVWSSAFASLCCPMEISPYWTKPRVGGLGFKIFPMSFCHRQGCGAQDAVGSNSCCWIQHWRTGFWAPLSLLWQWGLGPSGHPAETKSIETLFIN